MPSSALRSVMGRPFRTGSCFCFLSLAHALTDAAWLAASRQGAKKSAEASSENKKGGGCDGRKAGGDLQWLGDCSMDVPRTASPRLRDRVVGAERSMSRSCRAPIG